jgi:hypothetical protein
MNLRAMLINCNVDNGGTNTNDLFSWHDQPIFLYSQHCVIFLLALFAGISTPLVLSPCPRRCSTARGEASCCRCLGGPCGQHRHRSVLRVGPYLCDEAHNAVAVAARARTLPPFPFASSHEAAPSRAYTSPHPILFSWRQIPVAFPAARSLLL